MYGYHHVFAIVVTINIVGGEDKLITLHQIKALDEKDHNVKIHENQSNRNHDVHTNSYTVDIRKYENDYFNETNSVHTSQNIIKFLSLQNKSRGAEKVVLPFSFPFYTKHVSSVYVTTEGFLSLGNVLHRHMHHYAYIAPLLSNLVPSAEDGEIKMIESPNYVTFQWINVLLEKNPRLGKLSFGCTLHRNGQITFTYKQLPTTNSTDETLINLFENRSSALHGLSKENSIQANITVGLSDALIQVDHVAKQHKISSKNKISIDLSDISGKSQVTFTPLVGCKQRIKCYTCLDKSLSGKCVWCAGSHSCFNTNDLSTSSSRFGIDNCIVQGTRNQDYCPFEERTPPKYIFSNKDSITPFYQIHWIDHESLKRNNLNFWEPRSVGVVQIPINNIRNGPFSVRLPFSFPFFNKVANVVRAGKMVRYPFILQTSILKLTML